MWASFDDSGSIMVLILDLSGSLHIDLHCRSFLSLANMDTSTRRHLHAWSRYDDWGNRHVHV